MQSCRQTTLKERNKKTITVWARSHIKKSLKELRKMKRIAQM